jgi:heterodisulfide reductase subunit D
MESQSVSKIRCMSELAAANKSAEYLFWVGSAGSYDERIKKITKAFAKLLVFCKVDFAILGTEESDSGDVARRAGNEFLFQMQAMQNIETLKMYHVTKIITCDPHDFNTLKNEYPDLGGNFEVQHHSQFINELILTGKLKVEHSLLKDKSITFHDPCYLGRGNGIYQEPRNILNVISPNLTEMKRNKQRSLCCGAGGAQMFKEAEKGNMEVFSLRTGDAIETKAEIIATACPFCMTMLTDGIKMAEKQNSIKVFDIAELLVQALGIE